VTSRLTTHIARPLVDDHVRGAERRRAAVGPADVRARTASTTAVGRRVRSLASLGRRGA
jgi:hypothetical protein